MKTHANTQQPAEVSRRKFIATVGLAAATGGMIVSGATALAAGPNGTASVPVAGNWPWVNLDPQEAAERAFRNYHAKDG